MAGLATTLYAAYHFHRLAPYGVLANLLAMPVVSAWVMPMGIARRARDAVRLRRVFWRLMGIGIEWMIAVALWVASLPGAVGRMHGVRRRRRCCSATPALVVICLLRTPLRWIGRCAAWPLRVWSHRARRSPTCCVAPRPASPCAARTGGLSVLKLGSDTFAVREWLAADADARAPAIRRCGDGVRCDEAGCIARLADGALVAVVLHAEAFEEDCRRAAVVVTRARGAARLRGLVVDRNVWRAHGAMALRAQRRRLRVTEARPPGYDRPWARRRRR